MKNEQIIRIAELSTRDPDYLKTRWAVLGPVWVGPNMKTRLTKMKTLEGAIEFAERENVLDYLLLPIEKAWFAVVGPQRISAMKDTLKKAAELREKYPTKMDWSPFFEN